MKDFWLIYNCKNIIRDKNPQPTEPESPDFLKMCLTVLKVFYTKEKPYIIQYRSYKKFLNKAFINDLQNTFFNSTLAGQTVPLKIQRKLLT